MKNFLIYFFIIFSTTICNAKMQNFGSIAAYVSSKKFDQKKATLVFIHGTPGTHESFEAYYKDPRFIQRYNMIAIDRPGFGHSTHFKSTTHPDMAAQSKMISVALKKALPKSSSFSLVAHSYGAPLAILIAKVFKSRINNLFLISGPFSPKYKMAHWYNRWIDSWIFQRILPKPWLIANQEMLGLDKNLKGLVSYSMLEIKSPTYFIHGRSDYLVPFKHSLWAHKMRKNNGLKSQIHAIDSGHFMLWTQSNKIKKIILSHTNKS